MKNTKTAGFQLPPGTLEPLEIELPKGRFARVTKSSVGRKYLMAITGLIWCGYLVEHLIGNWLIVLAGQDAYNNYAHAILSLGPLIIVAELFLLACLVVHIVFAVEVTLRNRSARPERYDVDKPKGQRSLASNTMIWTGIVSLVFLVIHLLNLKFNTPLIEEGRGWERDFYTEVIELFKNPLYVLWYVVAVSLLGLHVGHGLQSALRTLGWNTVRAMPKLMILSIFFGIMVAVAYSALPLWAYFVKGGEA